LIQTPRHINNILDEIKTGLSNETSTLGNLVDVMHERGFGILIFLFALPMAIPLPVPPGVNLLFSVPLLFLTFQQIYGAKKPWLPRSIRQKSINKSKLDKMIDGAKPWTNRLSVFIKPRLAFVTHGYISHVIGIFGFLFALCVSIPVPMTNTVPSFAILLMAIGILMRDGLAIIGGMVIGSIWVVLLATLGVSGFKALLSFIISLLQ